MTMTDERNFTHWFQLPRWFARLLRVEGCCPCRVCDYWLRTPKR